MIASSSGSRGDVCLCANISYQVNIYYPSSTNETIEWRHKHGELNTRDETSIVAGK